jgi:hypothetical protein
LICRYASPLLDGSLHYPVGALLRFRRPIGGLTEYSFGDRAESDRRFSLNQTQSWKLKVDDILPIHIEVASRQFVVQKLK